jgi:hypothetical protein
LEEEMKTYVGLISMALILTACSGGQVKRERLQHVKRVAIVGLDLEQQKPVSGMDLAGLMLGKKGSGSAEHKMAIESAHAEQVYNDLTAKLSRSSGWQVMKQADLKKHPAYTKLFREKTEGMQSRPAVHERYEIYRAPGVLDTWPVMLLEEAQSKALAKELGVDALVYAKAQVNLNNSSLFSSMIGKGEFKPSSNLSLYVTEGVSGEKILVQTTEGPEVEKGASNTMGVADDAKVNALAQQAASLSMDQMFKELKLKN